MGGSGFRLPWEHRSGGNPGFWEGVPEVPLLREEWRLIR